MVLIRRLLLFFAERGHFAFYFCIKLFTVFDVTTSRVFQRSLISWNLFAVAATMCVFEADL